MRHLPTALLAALVTLPATAAAGEPALPGVTCTAYAEHVFNVLQATGTPETKAVIRSPKPMLDACRDKTFDPDMARCMMAAKTEAAIDDCARKPFLKGPVDATPKRSINAAVNDPGLQPPPMTRDGDYLFWDEDCGMLYREVPPAAAVFIACKGKVQIGPLVNLREMNAVMNQLMHAEKARHEIVMGIINRMPSGDFTVPVHVYDADGRYKGIERR